MSACPEDIIESLQRYEHDGVPTGDFLYAVLTNDLTGALGRADDNNRKVLFEIVQWCYNKLPGNIWGSREAVKSHLQKMAETRRRTNNAQAQVN
jgi:hypothetical protein